MLKVSGLDVDIGPVPILRSVDLSVPPGQMCGLIGRNGAGKTTFMRSVMGQLKVKAGSIEFEHFELVKVHDFKRAHLGIGFMPEDRRLVPDLTAEDNVLIPAHATDLEDAGDRLDWIYGLMPEVAEFRHRSANQLSGGQQKLVALARALMVGTKLLLLDEPTEGIAPILARRMVEVLSDLKNEGLSVLIAESNDTHLKGLLDTMYVIERGSIAGNGAA
ncbi:MAG: ATP-binding cassette domain-containing protein [Rhodospirillaceae bacterium]|nr:ATP-binding cassette domain-containing protein [Rhodospirillaceae bacterium]MBT6138700.1 ATP-binding cassette domain-containing protein [Rhodospirillaceae bacterium]